MNYRIEKIPPEGVTAKGEREKDWLGALFSDQKRAEFTFGSPLFYNILLRRSGETIFVSGSIKVEVELICSRCLEEFIYIINPQFRFSLSPVSSEKIPFEKELKPEDMDKEFYEGDAIDLGKIIKNQIILSLPLNPLCRDDCKGLCQHCGINKNKESCECSKKEIIDSKLSELKKLLQKTNQN